ncbi:DNA helicase [Roseomonas sp. NAR14]|uniref:DNA helicase n=1 Tax=Roseomonas acroporae TaxID=2937791 RepID=A0A9X2BV97_9PROT|nr:helicase-related protein [Roseomonas acroporae]MCK8784841.1 DNA helicase [Roseomonas acroporae]
MFAPRVRAVLGPTNTGKTHLAITRLLAHASGIIGFPLRLLARENYDRMVAAKGERHVALITGEEKIVPPEAKWFACTVEAMPLDRRAEFVAVDEIQLCADPDRGHVFTDRLLHARGMVETMFLGAETIRPLLQRLVPGAEIETRPRLSQLTYAGPAKLTRLPARSAVVAFSAGEVYAIAEAIRRRRGGCAVVMGRLSPRTRNAQVALYQNREVDFLVATDAIGMGLNMDVDHVAFANLTKFDGHRPRALTAQEAAQIAGRAGRGMRDGTFGVTGECEPLDDGMVEKIEGHHFEPLETLAWRSSDLDFASIDGLLDSLARPPEQPGLAKGNDATDHITLEALSREPEVRALADRPGRVKQLWDACQVPDFRKLADDSHTALCSRLFRHLVNDGAVPADWIEGQIAQLNRIDGDLDTLMARLAGIRVWAYVAARNDWTTDAARFQAETRAAEDAVSDALHERLTARFVDRRAAQLIRSLDDSEEDLLSAVTRRGEVAVEGHNVGEIKGFSFTPDPSATKEEDRKLVLRAARRALREEMPRRVGLLESAADNVFALTPTHHVTWVAGLPGLPPGAPGTQEPAEVARLRAGPEPGKPQIEVLASEFLDGAQRERIRLRLARWLDAQIARELGALRTVEEKAAEDGALRGPAFTLRENLGLAPGATEREVGPELRSKLKAIGVRAGRFALYVPEALKPRAMALRAQLWSLLREVPTPALPNPGLVAVPVPEDWPPGFAATMGWLPAGPMLLRLDVAERIAGELGFATRRAPAVLPGDLASRLGVRADALPAALTALGFRLLTPPPLAENEFGPPLPTRVAIARPAEGNRHRGPHRGQAHGQGHGQGHGQPSRQGGAPRQRQHEDQAAREGASAVPREGAPAVDAAAGAEAGAGGDAAAREARPPRERQRQGKPWAGKPRGEEGRRGAPAGRERNQGDRQGQGAGQGSQGQEGRPGEGPRGPRPPQGGAGGRQQGRNEGEGRAAARPNPDSPFAILAQLKLR